MTHRKLIYHPSGRAGEYADKGYAINLYKGCTHGCKYCYVPSRWIPKDKFHASVVPTVDVLPRLEADMKRVGKLPEPIFLCFTCDPYCADAPHIKTRMAIATILEAGNRVNILTKGGMIATRDFDLLAGYAGNKIGATLTFADEKLSLEWEPKAAPPIDRVNMLAIAKGKGIETWASIEPVIDPIQSLRIMEASMSFVDTFKIGKWNHDKRANDINWRNFLMRTVEMMKDNNKGYIIKEDLRRAAK